MRLGLTISIVLHLAILAWAAISIGTARPPVTPDEVPVEVSLLSVSDFANMRKGSDTAKVKTTSMAPKEADPTDAPPVEAKHIDTPPPPAADPVPPEPQDTSPAVKPKADPIAAQLAKADPATPTTPPDPTPAKPVDPIADQLAKPDPAIDEAQKAQAEEEKRKAAEAEAKRQKELAKKAADEKRARDEAERQKKLAAEAKRKQKLLASLDKLQAQISQLPDAAPDAGSDATPDPMATKAPAVGVKHPTGTQLSATEQQMFLATFSHKVQGCWTVLAGAADARELVVPVSFDLNPDGSLKSDPVVTGGAPSPSFSIAAENVVRAIKQCAPYPLPPADYAKWEHWDIDFDPRAMFGG